MRSTEQGEQPEGVSTVCLDLTSGTASFTPDSFCLFGTNPPDTLQGLLEAVDPRDRRSVADVFAQLKDRAVTRSVEFRILSADGSIHPVFAQLTATRADSGCTRLRGVFIRKFASGSTEDQAAEASVPFGDYEADVSADGSNWSPGLRQFLSLASVVDSGIEKLTHSVFSDDRRYFVDRVNAALAAPGPFDMTFRVTAPGGLVRWIRDRGESFAANTGGGTGVGRVSGSLSDVTAQMENTHTDRESQHTFWKMIDSAPFGVYAVDADFRIVRISEGGRAVFEGIEPILGRDLGEVLRILWPEPFATEAINHFRHTLETGEPYRAPPVVEHRADRRVVEAYDWGIDRMRLADGRLGVICHFYDLTERVRFERELREREQRLNLAYDAGDLGAWEVDLETGEVTGTPQLMRLLGAADESDDLASLWQDWVHPEDRERVNTAFEAAVAGGPPFDVDFRISRPDGEVRFMASKAEVLLGEAGTPVRVSGINFDITNRKMAELAMRDSEQRLRAVIDNTVAFIGVLDNDGILQEANETALRAGGVSRLDVIGRHFWETYWWSHDPAVADRLKDAVEKAAQGNRVRYDEVVRMAGDTLMTIEFMVAPVFDGEGKVRMLVVSGFDISERESARAHVQSLLGEINHRTKNILTLVQILARQTARGGGEDFVERFQKRIKALADAQDLLVASSSDRADLEALTVAQIGHFQDLLGSRIHLDGAPVTLAPHAAQAIGMALHELSTNAGKYGALSQDQGEIHLSWTTRAGDDGEELFDLWWVESGGPSVTPPDHSGFGSTVIRTMTESSLDGTVALDFRPEGLSWKLTCALRNLTSRD